VPVHAHPFLSDGLLLTSGDTRIYGHLTRTKGPNRVRRLKEERKKEAEEGTKKENEKNVATDRDKANGEESPEGEDDNDGDDGDEEAVVVGAVPVVGGPRVLGPRQGRA
jgi:hypothetical protein